MAMFIQEYYIFFMVVLLSLSIFILLRSIVGILAQVVFFVAILLISLTNIVWLVNVLFAIQIAVALFSIYRLKGAIDYNYQIVLEKTHLADRYYTKTDYSGSKKSFFS